MRVARDRSLPPSVAGYAPGSAGYADAAERLLATRLDFDAVHAPYLHLFPDPPARILDVGAGPGHDAALLAGLGHQVVAAEPTPASVAAAGLQRYRLLRLWGLVQVHPRPWRLQGGMAD